MKYNIAVVDDVRLDGELLQRGIQKWFTENAINSSRTVTCFSDCETFLKDLEPQKFQIIFMDILMDSMNGIEAAKKIRDFDNHSLIVFTTASNEFAFEAFPLHPFDYILKPCNSERINYVMSEAIKFFERPDEFITVRVARSRYEIPISKISAIRADGHFVELVMTMGNSLLCSMKFSEFEELLKDDPRFLTCNRGVIINMDNVLSLSRDKLSFIMKDNSYYPIKIRKRTKILEKFTQYQISRLRGDN